MQWCQILLFPLRWAGYLRVGQIHHNVVGLIEVGLGQPDTHWKLVCRVRSSAFDPTATMTISLFVDDVRFWYHPAVTQTREGRQTSQQTHYGESQWNACGWEESLRKAKVQECTT